jgi:fatty acid desaturase
MTTINFDKERNIEKDLRRYSWVIPVVSFATAGILFLGLYMCMKEFQLGFYWAIFPAGLMAHAFFIILVHDGAHRAITRTKADQLIMNLGASFMLLPFYGEPFRKYHLVHHANTNSEIDPLWNPLKRRLYNEKRWLYLICEFIPFIFKCVLLLSTEKNILSKKENIKQPTIRVPYLIFSFLISGILIWLWLPPIWFIIGTLFWLNTLSLIRHWCEHIGTEKNKESNTFWFPLGMGIGNHEAHHEFPHFSWLTMMIGLYHRKKDTNPFKTLYGILFNRAYLHYEEIKVK